MLDIYSIGEMVIDFIPGSEKASYIRNAGGAPANVAIAVAKNGLKAGLCCSVGDDDFGRFLIDTLKNNNVTCIRTNLCKEAITTMAFVSLSENGERTFTFARKPGADMFLCEDDVSEKDIAVSSIVHAGSCSMSSSPTREATEKALRLGHELEKIVSYDINYRNLMWNNDKKACTNAVRNILQYVDILKISEEEVDMLGGENNLFQEMKKYNITLIVETLGSAGAKCFFNGAILENPGIKAKAIDATGAGDAFWGGFISSLRIQNIATSNMLSKDVILAAMKYGNVAGWICVQSKGAIASLPTRDQIEQYI